MKQRYLGSAIVLVTLVPAGPAMATGFLTARFGGEHGNPTTENATAMYYNPAGLAFAGTTQLYLDGTFAWIKASYERPAEAISPVYDPETSANSTGTPKGREDTNSGKNSVTNFAAAPFVGAVSNFGIENLGVALGFYAPFGGASVWDKKDEYEDDPVFGGAYDGSQRWWSIEGTLRSVYLTAAGAYYVPAARLSFGLGVNLVMSEIHTIRARNSAGDDAVAQEYSDGKFRNAEGRSRIDVAGKTVSVGAGLIWKPTDDVSVGASYQSQPGFGKMTMEGDLELSFNGQPAETSKVRLEEELPDVIRLGASWRIDPKWSVRLFGEYDRWSVFDRQCLVKADSADGACDLDSTGDPNPGADDKLIVQNIQRDWEDAMAIRAGASYFLSDRVELYLGAGYDGNAVPDERLDPAIPDFTDFSGALGARAEFLDNALALAGTYTQIFYLSREVDSRPRDGMGNPQSGLKTGTSLQPDAAGKYTRSIGVFNLNVEYAF